MLRHQRRVLIDCLGIGVALTLLTIAADVSGMLAPLENWLYDARARYCQLFTAPPTDTLVHIDIDDNALEVMGRWPWPRARLAQVLEELGRAGPRAIELDVLLSEPQAIEYLPRDAVSSTAPGAFVPFDNDAELAQVIAKLGNVIVPATLEPPPRRSAIFAAMVEVLRDDLELDEGDLIERLRARGVTLPQEGLGDVWIRARRDAIRELLAELKVSAETPFDDVRARLLPRTPPEVQSGPANVLRDQWTRFLAGQAFERFALPMPPGLPSLASLRFHLTPIRVLSDAAAGGAFANHIQFGSPVIRALPVLLEREGKVYPQMGLALAARMLDADLHRMRVERNRLLIPRAGGGEIAIPLSPPQIASDGVAYSSLIDIPWFGGRRWEYMYDPRGRERQQHLPLTEVWNACATAQKIARNNASIDEAIRGLYEATDDVSRLERHNASIPPPEDFAAREKIARPLLEEFAPFASVYATMPTSDMAHRDKVFAASFKALQQALASTPQLVMELDDSRALLARQLKDKAVLIGWTATAAIADFVPTSLHDQAPGVVVHGVIYNGIMTGELWGRLPWWTGDAFALVMGIATALVVGFFSPVRGLIVAAALVIAYVIVNGLVLFDFANTIVTAAAPLTTVAIVWSMCTLTRIRVEQAERDRITRRFSNYADSRLVDYVIESEQLTFEGEDREVTIVFTDLAGFTSLSERLGPRVVPVLNDLLDELVPVIREYHAGYINKFIGDGIMFFYNAPMRHNNHASEAVATVLDMHAKVSEFNARLRLRELPELAMRGGIASGVVVVGDAGGGGRSDYTCLGDAVNLSSRLEAANKQLGTRTLINDRGAQLLNGAFLLRPVGRLKVVGKEEAVMCHEPLGRLEEATDEQRMLAKITSGMVAAFIAGGFDDVKRCADELEAKFGGSKLAALYRSLAIEYLLSPPADFDGRIVLTEK